MRRVQSVRGGVKVVVVAAALLAGVGSLQAAPLAKGGPGGGPVKAAVAPSAPAQVDGRQVPFAVSAPNRPFQSAVAVTAPGGITVEVALQAASGKPVTPVAVYLRNEATGQISASATVTQPNGRLTYNVPSADVASGAAVYSLLITASQPVAGTVKLAWPRTDPNLLAAYLNRLAPQQKANLSALLGGAPQAATPQPAAGPASAAKAIAVAPSVLPPRIRLLPHLERSPTTQLLTPQPVDISRTIDQSPQAAPIPFRPFTLDEVFDLQTGKPLFAAHIDEATGDLRVPHPPNIKITPARNMNTQEFQQRGLTDTLVKQGAPIRFGKLDRGAMTLKSRIVLPRRDGAVTETSAEHYLNELNDFERHLNALGMTLRDSRTGKIKTTPVETRLAKSRQNFTLLNRQFQESDRVLKKNLPVRPWTGADINALHTKAISGIAIRKPGRVQTVAAPSERALGLRTSSVAAAQAQSKTIIGQMMARNELCILKSVQEGAQPNEELVLEVDKHDNGCFAAVQDSAGASVEVPLQLVDAGHVKLRLPPQVRPGKATLKYAARASMAASSGGTGHELPFFVGPECSIVSVYPPQGAADVKLTLTVARFANCQAVMEEAGKPVNAKNPLTLTKVDATTVTTTVPNLGLGSAKIKVSRAASPNQVSSQADFKILRTVIDGNGNAPPPDFFAMGLKPFAREYPWSMVYGEPETFAVGVYTMFSISSKGAEDNNKVKFKGDASTKATLYNNEVEIIGAHAEASIPSATSTDSKLRANFKVTAAGQTVYRLEKQKDKETKATEAVCDDSAKDKNGKCCEDKDQNNVCIAETDGVSVTVQYKLEKDFKLFSIDKSVETKFTLGPVPMVARIGFRGTAGSKVHVALSPIQVIATADPYVRTAVYGECGVDLAFASAGIGANLTLANIDINAGGRATLDFGQLAIQADLYLRYKYDLLSGNLYAYLNIFGQPYRQSFYDWTGFKGDGYLLPPQTLTFPLFPS